MGNWTPEPEFPVLSTSLWTTTYATRGGAILTPLDPSRTQIRLLRLEPDPSDLGATLEVVSS